MKKLKRIVVALMTVLLLFGIMSVGMTSVAANKKVTKIKLNKTSVSIYIGKTYTLKPTISPSNATNKKVKWTTSNSSVATVSSSGKITAKKAGTATITCKAADGSGQKATCKVTVKNPVKVTKVKLNYSSKSIYVGKTYTLKATVSPSNATDKSLKWTTSNSSVATVNSSGKVTAKKPGTATITCKAADGSGKKATCKITVKAVEVSSVDLNRSAVSVTIGKTYTLKADVSPSNATNKSLSWKTSNSKVATVSSSGKITAVGVGTATITATAKDGSGEKDTCKVTVKPVLVSKITLSSKSYTGNIGESFKLEATVSPSNATNKTIKWSSSDKSVATVTSSGTVKLVAPGEATITAKSADGNAVANCQVIVKSIKVTSIKLSASKKTVGLSDTFTLKATVSPSNATNKNIVWYVSDQSILFDSGDGTFTAIKPGTVTVTAMATDGSDKEASCTVTVDTTEVKTITLSNTELVATPGFEGDVLTATVAPSYATNKNVIWSSEDESVAQVDEYGAIEYVGIGETYIKATAADGKGAYAKCKITVLSKIPVTKIKLSKTTYTGNMGGSVTLTATVTPDRADNKGIVWKSSNTSVATVSSGYVKFVGGGKATITATAADGSGVSAKCDITVVAKASEIGIFSTVDSWYVGKTGQLKAYVSPETANQSVTWSSSDTKYATVDANGNVKIIKADSGLFGSHKDKDITITATAKDGSGVTGTYKLTIKEKVNVTKVSFSAANYGAYVGQVITPVVTIEPSNASETQLNYKSSDTQVIKVENGKLIAVGEGSATVTATSTDGTNHSSSAVFNVQYPQLFLTTSDSSDYYAIGDTVVLQAIWFPETVGNDLGIKTVIGDEDKVKLISSQKRGSNCIEYKYQIVEAGETEIYATTNDGFAKSEGFPLEIRGVNVKDYFDGIKAGDRVTINPKVAISEDRVFLSENMQCQVPAMYENYLSVKTSAGNTYEIEVLKELPKTGAYVTVIPDPSKPEFKKNIYFVSKVYETISQDDAFDAIKKYTKAASSASGKQDKFVNYNDLNIIKSDITLSSSNILTNMLLQASMKDMTPEELGASDMVYIVFGDSENSLGESVSKGVKAITVDESNIKSCTVIDNGSYNYRLVLTLDSQPAMSNSSVGSSVYSKTMPVIDASAVSKFKNGLSGSLQTGSDDFKLEKASEGTMTQAYKGGKVVLTINKLTDKVEKCDYYFVSDMKFSKANMDVSVKIGSLGTISMNTVADFTVSVEEKISIYDLKY